MPKGPISRANDHSYVVLFDTAKQQVALLVELGQPPSIHCTRTAPITGALCCPSNSFPSHCMDTVAAHRCHCSVPSTPSQPRQRRWASRPERVRSSAIQRWPASRPKPAPTPSMARGASHRPSRPMLARTPPSIMLRIVPSSAPPSAPSRTGPSAVQRVPPARAASQGAPGS